MREWGREKPHGKSLWWPVVARNKRSVTCNLRDPEGQALRPPPARPPPTSLVENFRPGTLERWGLGARARCGEINPGLIITRVTGYGQTGPYAPRAGFGSVGEAMGGIRYVMGDPDTPPVRAGISLGDTLAATFACLGTLVALHSRQRTGRGQVVDSAIYEAVLAMMESLSPSGPWPATSASAPARCCRTSRRATSTRPATATWCSSRRTRTPCSAGSPRPWTVPSSPTTSATRPTAPAAPTWPSSTT